MYRYMYVFKLIVTIVSMAKSLQICRLSFIFNCECVLNHLENLYRKQISRFNKFGRLDNFRSNQNQVNIL